VRAASATAIADFNEDSVFDLVTINELSGDVAILLGRNDGSFLTTQQFSLTASPFAVVVSDLNGDGSLDLVVAHRSVVALPGGSGTISILLGQSDGTFIAPQAFSVENFFIPSTIAVEDLNGDGIPDLITASSSMRDILILFGQGDGTFGPPQRFQVGSPVVSVMVADLNGDNRQDLITVTNDFLSRNLVVLLAQEDGSFVPGPSLLMSSNPATVVLTDLDGDGTLDLVFEESLSGGFAMLSGREDGSFTPERRIPIRISLTTLAVVDLNEDGMPDLVTADTKSGALTILLGTAEGSFVRLVF
jgi:hypothetical protein